MGYNSNYQRDKYIAQVLGVEYVPFSGSRWASGREDARSQFWLVQSKSTTGRNATVKFLDLFQLQQHAFSQRMPIMVLDFINPVVNTVDGKKFLPDEQWCLLRLAEFKRIWHPSTVEFLSSV